MYKVIFASTYTPDITTITVQQHSARTSVYHADLKAFIRDFFKEDNPVKELQIRTCHPQDPGHRNHQLNCQVELLSILRAQAKSPTHFTCKALEPLRTVIPPYIMEEARSYDLYLRAHFHMRGMNFVLSEKGAAWSAKLLATLCWFQSLSMKEGIDGIKIVSHSPATKEGCWIFFEELRMERTRSFDVSISVIDSDDIKATRHRYQDS